MFKHTKENQITAHFPFFVFLLLDSSRETARFQILFFSFQNENPLAAKYTDLSGKVEF